jgi:hypothetical protein
MTISHPVPAGLFGVIPHIRAKTPFTEKGAKTFGDSLTREY